MRETLRILRSATWITCLGASVAFAALWGRSYYWSDTFAVRTRLACVEVGSYRGSVGANAALLGNRRLKPKASLQHASANWIAGGSAARQSHGHFFFSFEMVGNSPNFIFPHWFPFLLAGAAAFAIKPKPRLKFSVRDVLVATTLLAVTAGAVKLAEIPRYVYD